MTSNEQQHARVAIDESSLSVKPKTAHAYNAACATSTAHVAAAERSQLELAVEGRKESSCELRERKEWLRLEWECSRAASIKQLLDRMS